MKKFKTEHPDQAQCTLTLSDVFRVWVKVHGLHHNPHDGGSIAQGETQGWLLLL